MVLEDTAQVVSLKEVKEFVLPASSGALIKCGNELIMYQRDNKPNIPHPGKLAIFGGRIDSVEEIPIIALTREIGEELNIEISEEQVRYLGTLAAGDDQDHIKHISLVEITPEQKSLIVKGPEGKELKFFTPDNLPDADALVPDLKVFFVDHRDKLISWLNGEDITASDLGLKKNEAIEVA